MIFRKDVAKNWWKIILYWRLDNLNYEFIPIDYLKIK